MKRNLVILMTIVTLIVGILVGRAIPALSVQGNIGFIPALHVIGDIENPLHLNEVKSAQMVALNDLVRSAKPFADEFNVLLVSNDGAMAELRDGLEGCSLGFSPEYGWFVDTETYPPSSNIKNLKEIVVIADESSWETGLNIVSPSENLVSVTEGQMYLRSLQLLPYLAGESSQKSQAKSYHMGVYSQRKAISLDVLLGNECTSSVLVFGKEGTYRENAQSGYVTLRNGAFSFLIPDEKKEISDVKGFMVNPPELSVSQTYHDALYHLHQGRKVLVLFLDGFGYHQYTYAINNGYAPYLSNLPSAEPATTVYKPVTNAGFAAIVTGKPPQENGVFSRSERKLQVPDLFAKAAVMGKSSILIEGNTKILDTDAQVELNIDSNDNGSTDDEVFTCAIEKIKEERDLVMVHFHGIDDMGHEFGDLHENTMAKITEVDSYVKQLAEEWSGTIIIVADHGMHSTGNAGSHGTVRYEDLVVPYIVVEER